MMFFTVIGMAACVPCGVLVGYALIHWAMALASPEWWAMQWRTRVG